MEGYIKLYRKMIDWEWFRNSNTLHVFMYCLMSASWTRHKYKGVWINKGCFPTSVSALSEATGMSTQEARTSLKHLQSTGEISVKSTNRFSIVKVENFSKYNGLSASDFEEEAEANNQITSNQQTSNKQVTNNQQTIKILKDIKSNKGKEDISINYSLSAHAREDPVVELKDARWV